MYKKLWHLEPYVGKVFIRNITLFLQVDNETDYGYNYHDYNYDYPVDYPDGVDQFITPTEVPTLPNQELEGTAMGPGVIAAIFSFFLVCVVLFYCIFRKYCCASRFSGPTSFQNPLYRG